MGLTALKDVLLNPDGQLSSIDLMYNRIGIQLKEIITIKLFFRG